MRTKKDFFKEIRENCEKQIAEIEVEIGVLQNLVPNTVVSQRRLSNNSYEDITAEKMLEIKSKELSSWVQKENVVLNLLGKC